MSTDTGVAFNDTPAGRVLHAAYLRGYLSRQQTEELLAWSQAHEILHPCRRAEETLADYVARVQAEKEASRPGSSPAQAAAGSPQAEPILEAILRLSQSSIESRLLAMLEGAAPDGPAPQEPDDLNPARMLRLTEAQAGRFFLAVCHAYGPLTPARLAGWLAGEED
jgi:hypothetical protein